MVHIIYVQRERGQFVHVLQNNWLHTMILLNKKQENTTVKETKIINKTLSTYK